MSRSKIVNVASVPHRSPFRYPGGKTWLIPQIRRWMNSLEYRPKHFVEPFAGGAIVGLTAGFEDFADHVTLVELDPEIYSVWKAVTSRRYKLLSERILEFEVTRENVVAVLDAKYRSTLDLAFRTIVKNRMQHGGIMAPGASLMRNGEKGKGLMSRWYPSTLAKRIEAIGQIRDKFDVVKDDGIAIMKRYSRDAGTAFFIDPPYTAAGKKAGKRLYRFNELNHTDLFQTAASAVGDVLLTYDNAAGVVDLACESGFDVEPIAMKNTHHAKMTELLVGKNLDWARRGTSEVQGTLAFD